MLSANLDNFLILLYTNLAIMPIDIVVISVKGGVFLKKRFISFILAILILIPILPKPIEAKGFAKEIDVIYNDLKLKVEGKNVSSKEPFIYDEDLWVPIKDLGKSLGIEVNFNSSKRILKFNSNGKLNLSNNSKANIAYQRGYEVQAKERIIKELDKEIRTFEGRHTAETSSTAGTVRNISVGFSNIDVYLDGTKVYLDREPLIYNNDLYISLSALSPLLYITSSLNGNVLNIDSNAVLVKKDGFTSVDYLASFNDNLNNRLTAQLSEIEKRKNILMDVKIPYEEIKTLSQMEKYLNKHLGEISDLPVDVSLRSGTRNWYDIDIDLSTRYNNRWRKLSRRDVEAYVWDIFVAITTLYDEDAKIQGNIRNPRYSYSSSSQYRNYVEFDTKVKDLVFSFINSNLDISEKVDPIFIEELLQKELGRYGNERFDYSARISGYDLDLIVTPSSKDYINRWSPNRQLNFLERINTEIRRYYPGLKINGKVICGDLEPIVFGIEDNKVRSVTLMDDTNEYLNERFGTLYTEHLRIPMKYSLNQIDTDNFKLMVDMDFLVSDSRWDAQAKDNLVDLIDDAMGFILGMWDTNVFVQVYDKTQALEYEYIISQNTVHMVKASPKSGTISEGSTVSLRTSTSGSKIYYTLDGSTPSENSNLYSNPIVISTTTTLKTFALKNGFKDSPISTFEYTVVPN